MTDKPEASITVNRISETGERVLVVSTPLGRIIDSNGPVHRALRDAGIVPKFQKAGYYVLTAHVDVDDMRDFVVKILRSSGIKVAVY